MENYSSPNEKLIYAKDFHILSGKEISKELTKMLVSIQGIQTKKTIIFEKGTYHIDSRQCQQALLYITNTTGDNEFEAWETPHLNTVAMFFKSIQNLTFDGNDSTFIIDGKATNIAILQCENIVLKNLEICHAHPDMHEFEVLKKTDCTIDFLLDTDTLYRIEDGNLIFYGNDYQSAADKNADSSYWIGLIKKDTPDIVRRVLHPLAFHREVTEIEDRQIRVVYDNTERFDIGDCFYFYDVRRQFSGIFVEQSKNLTFINVRQRFNYSLAFVAQDSEDIFIDGVDFSPKKNGPRKLASAADFVQICMCRGQILIQNSNFDGAGDDCLNIHGVHFKIANRHGNDLIVRYMHSQTHGFNPLRSGDEIAFIDPETLLEKGRSKIKASSLINEYEIRLTLDTAAPASIGDVIEDISACPSLTFKNNRIQRIITRGLLVTTRGKVLIEKNHFFSTAMSGVLLSDDARNWYESGMCCNVSIRENIFDYCGETPILISPENTVHHGAVHKNIEITNNIFYSYDGVCIFAKSTDHLFIKENQFRDKNYLEVENCNHVIID